MNLYTILICAIGRDGVWGFTQWKLYINNLKLRNNDFIRVFLWLPNRLPHRVCFSCFQMLAFLSVAAFQRSKVLLKDTPEVSLLSSETGTLFMFPFTIYHWFGSKGTFR